MTPVWFEVDPRRRYPYCVLRFAVPGGRISTLCLDGDGFTGALSYRPLLVTTQHPGELACRACDRHLAVTMRGAAVAVESSYYDEINVARAETVDLRRGPDVGVAAEWDDLAVKEEQ